MRIWPSGLAAGCRPVRLRAGVPAGLARHGARALPAESFRVRPPAMGMLRALVSVVDGRSGFAFWPWAHSGFDVRTSAHFGFAVRPTAHSGFGSWSLGVSGFASHPSGGEKRLWMDGTRTLDLPMDGTRTQLPPDGQAPNPLLLDERQPMCESHLADRFIVISPRL